MSSFVLCDVVKARDIDNMIPDLHKHLKSGRRGKVHTNE